MLNNQIRELRKKLDASIAEKKDYSEIYKLSVEMDELIAKYYKEYNGEKIETKLYGKKISKNGIVEMIENDNVFDKEGLKI